MSAQPPDAPDLDLWIDAVMTDRRLTGSALKFAWGVYRRAVRGEPATRWGFGGDTALRMTAFRGADVLERTGYLRIAREPGRRAALCVPALPARPHMRPHMRPSPQEKPDGRPRPHAAA